MDDKNLIDKSVDEILADILNDIDNKNQPAKTPDGQVELIQSEPEQQIETEDKEDKEYVEQQESEQLDTQKSETENVKKKRVKKPLLFVFIVLFVVALGFASWAGCDVFGLTGSNEKVQIIVEDGWNTSDIATVLKQNKIINSELLFKLCFKTYNPEGIYYSGVFDISPADSYQEIVNKLKTPGQTADAVTVTFPEGYNIDKIADTLEKNLVCSKDVFVSTLKTIDVSKYSFLAELDKKDLYYRLEGYLYPDTYEFVLPSTNRSEQECAQLVVYKMLDRTKQILDENDFYSLANSKGKSLHEVFTLASIVELEASAYPDEMPKVAQVFYNRLAWTDQPAMLGSTPTADYPDKRYDTNTNIGLPPGPLCSVSLNSLKAVLNPDTSVTADYFVTDKNMKFYYTDTLSEHNSLINRLKSEGLWN